MNDINGVDLHLADLFSGDIELVSPPKLYFEVNRLIESPQKSFSDIGQFIEKDPNLTAKLLKLVNSAFFGFPSQITTITQAISLVGMTELKNIILSTLIMEKFSDLPGGMMSIYEFWTLSLRIALISKEFYKQMKVLESPSKGGESETMFVCGLLHEIGVLLFYRKIPELAREIGLIVETTGVDEQSTEQRVIGFDHYQAGAELSRIWKLPEIIIATIQFHQHPELAGQYSYLTTMIKLASQISRKKSRVGFVGKEPDLNLISLSEIEINSIIQETDEQIEEIIKILCPT